MFFGQCVREDIWERMWKMYTADAIGALLNSTTGETSTGKGVPLFSEMFKRREKPMTAKEIKENVIQKLRN